MTVTLGAGDWRPARRLCALVIAALISAVPVLTVFVDKRPLGDPIAFGLALVLWPVVLARPGLRFRRHQHDATPPATINATIAVPIVLIELAVVGTIGTWNDTEMATLLGIAYGVAFAAATDLAGLVVTRALRGAGVAAVPRRAGSGRCSRRRRGLPRQARRRSRRAPAVTPYCSDARARSGGWSSPSTASSPACSGSPPEPDRSGS